MLGDLNSLYSILHHAPTTWFGSWFSGGASVLRLSFKLQVCSGTICGGTVIYILLIFCPMLLRIALEFGQTIRGLPEPQAADSSHSKSRTIAGRTARCHCTFRYVSNFITTSVGFSATARLSCTVLHQRPFKCWNYTQYADFYGRDVRHGDSRKSWHTTGTKPRWSSIIRQ